jgi:uncharacterized phage-associated protein
LETICYKGHVMDIKQIANYLIYLAKPHQDIDPDWEEYDFTHLKLQKLLYYAQSFFLAKYNEPLFKEKILAWQHGPVVEEIYKIYKIYRNEPIIRECVENDIAQVVADARVKATLEEVYRLYGQYSASKLRQKTHEEPPWRETKLNSEISHEKLKRYFLLIVG